MATEVSVIQALPDTWAVMTLTGAGGLSSRLAMFRVQAFKATYYPNLDDVLMSPIVDGVQQDVLSTVDNTKHLGVEFIGTYQQCRDYIIKHRLEKKNV